MLIQSTKTIENKNISILVYGQAGQGKTFLASTCEAPIIISSEAGLLSLVGYDIPYVEITKLSELQEVFKWAKSNESKAYKTLVLDSLSDIAEIILETDKVTNKDPRQAYLTMQEQVVKIIRGFRSLPFHIYFTAKSEKIQDENSRIMYGPSTPGTKLANMIPHFFDEVFALRTERNGDKIKRYLQCQPDGSWLAKDRSGKLGVTEPADLGAIIQKILEVKNE